MQIRNRGLWLAGLVSLAISGQSYSMYCGRGERMSRDEQVRQLFEAVRRSDSCSARELLEKNPDIDLLARDANGISLLEVAERALMSRRAGCLEGSQYDSTTKSAKRIADLICPTVHSILKARLAYAKLAARESQVRRAAPVVEVTQRPDVPQPATQPGTVETCSVCLEQLQVTVAQAPCGHRFHTRCLLQWGRDPRHGCPQCRANLETGAPEGSW